MKVTTNEIMAVAEVLCRHLDKCGHSEVDIDKTSYWAIPKEYEYDAYSEPKDCTLGDLEEEWSELLAMVSNPETAVGYGMVWFGSILRAIGQQEAC